MLHVDIPTLPEIKALVAARADACLSIYLPTTPETQHIGASMIELGNLAREGLAQLEAARLDKRRAGAIAEQLDHLADDDDFWAHQAHSHAILVTPDSLRT